MKIIIGLLVFVLFLVVTEPLFAHGGFEKIADTTLVHIIQIPVSPLVGEEVELTFVFTGREKGENLTNLPVKLSVIDTYFGDATKDKKIFEVEKETDTNGAFSFEYIFTKENYFDIDLDFKDKNGKDQEVGILVQPRKVASGEESRIGYYFTAFGLGIFLTLTSKILLKRRK